MNCYRHTEQRAVATCNQGCGRGLCPDCTTRYGQPICESCYTDIATEYQAALAADRSVIIKRLTINSIVLGGLILGMIVMQLALTVSETPNGALAIISALMGLPTLIWALINFNTLMDKLSEVTGMVFFTSLNNWCLIFLIGCVVIAPAAVVILPINIIGDVKRLRELS